MYFTTIMPVESDRTNDESFVDESFVNQMYEKKTYLIDEKCRYFGEDFAGREDCILPAVKLQAEWKGRKEIGPFYSVAQVTPIIASGASPKKTKRPHAPMGWRERERMHKKQTQLRILAWLGSSAAAAAALWFAISEVRDDSPAPQPAATNLVASNQTR